MDRVDELYNKIFDVINNSFLASITLREKIQTNPSLTSEQEDKFDKLWKEVGNTNGLTTHTLGTMIGSFKDEDCKDEICELWRQLTEDIAMINTFSRFKLVDFVDKLKEQMEEDEFLKYEDEFDAIAQREAILDGYIDNCFDYDTDELDEKLNGNQAGTDLGTSSSDSDSDDLDNDDKKGNLKGIIIAAAIGTVMIAGTIVGVVKLKGNKNYKIEKEGLSSQTTNVVVDDSSKHEDSSLNEEIEEEVSSLIESKPDEDSKAEEKEDDSKKDETATKSEDSKEDEYTVIPDDINYDEYFIAPDGSVWASEEDYNAYNEYEQNGTYSEDGYYVAPDGTVWTDEETYNEYNKYGEQSGYYTAPDGTIWESEEDYNLYMEYNDVNENVKVK